MKQQSKFLLAACAAILFSLSVMAAETQLVTATGYGMSVDEAKRAGVRAAVEAVVGTIVDAETLVENDELVDDKILSYSTGMVEDVKIVGVPKKNSAGLVKVRVQVKVRKTELVERVNNAIKTTAKIDGESLYQKVTFNQQNLNDAGSIMQSLFSPERMQGLLKFEPDMDKRNPIDVDMTTGEVTVAIKGGVDLAAYKQWTDEIIEKLGPMALEKSRERINTSWFVPSVIDRDLQRDMHLNILQSIRSGEAIRLKFDKNKYALLEKQLWPYSANGSETPWLISVSLLDKMGKEIKGAEFQAGLNYGIICETALFPALQGLHQIFPELQILDYTKELGLFYKVNVSFGALSVQDLREIDSVTCEVSVKPMKQNF